MQIWFRKIRAYIRIYMSFLPIYFFFILLLFGEIFYNKLKGTCIMKCFHLWTYEADEKAHISTNKKPTTDFNF